MAGTDQENFRLWRGYMVGDQGTIIGRKGRVRRLSTAHRMGYLTFRDAELGSQLVHRVVAEVWCDKPDGCRVVNHLNGDKRDNRAVNLEWTTQAANVAHSMATGLSRFHKPPGYGVGTKNNAARAVIADGRLFPYGRAAADALGISPQSLVYRLKSKNFPSYRYADEEPPPWPI